MAGNQPDALIRALLAHVPSLRRYAAALAGNTADADDLVQECIERALVRQDTLREPDSVGRWLRAILHNLYVTKVRRRRGASVPIEDFAEDLALSVPAGDQGQIRDLVRALGTLSVEHRQVVLLVSLEGLSYREVAEILNVPIGTVMSRLARARERLRSLLDGDEDRAVRRVR